MPDSKKLKILLVDDDEMIRIYFQDIFWIHGMEDRYDVTVVDTVEKAEALIRDPLTRPELLFMDLSMPMKKDGRIEVTPEAGINLLKKVKEDPEFKNIKVVVFSGYTEEIYRDMVKKMGAEMYLVKGSSLPQDILQFVENFSKK